MRKALAILIDPQGEEWFSAYGPMTKDRDKATEYISAEIATKAALNTFGRSAQAFWNSERIAEDNARARYRGWTFRVQEI